MVVAAVAVKFWVAVTVDMPPFSVMDGGARDSVTARVSSSLMVRVTGAAVGDGAVCCGLVAAAVTLTVLLAAATMSLLLAVMVTVPALVVAPGAMVSVLLADRAKSAAAAAPVGLAAIVMVVVALAVKFWVAVTVDAPPFSAMGVWDRDSVTVGESFSVMVSDTLAAVGAGAVCCVLVAEADTVTVLVAAT